MKRIYIYLLSAIVSLAFAPAVSAQTDYSIKGQIGDLVFQNNTDVYTVTNNVGVRKQVSAPVNGKYWIKLEAFATGEASVTSVSKPADIILVLDCSSSMTDSYGSESDTRLDALKTACKAFLTTIHDNDAAARALDPNYAGDRVAIITFNSSATTQFGLSQISDKYSSMYAFFGTGTGTIGTARGTDSAEGLQLAMTQWQNSSGAATTDTKRSRAVVLFTDGCPSTHGSYTFDCDIAGPAVNYANQFKNDYGASVYTVGLFDTGNDSWSSLQSYVLDYLNFVSSNFKNVTATYTSPWRYSNTDGDVNGTVTYTVEGYNSVDGARASANYADAAEAAAGGGGKFFFMASDDPSSLKSIFESIASQTGGAANTQLTAASTTTVDIVSESFLLPEGADENAIKVFTAKCTGADPYTFATEVLAHYDNTTDADDGIGVELGADANGNPKISISGFDYSHNWCGPIKNASGEITGYQGYKIIIMIPIIANPDAVGGPNVVTNTAESGIYIDGQTTPLIPFEYPTISLPVNIYIEKLGLKNGESAKFIIEKAFLIGNEEDGYEIPTSENAWTKVTSIFVTNSENAIQSEDGNPIVMLRGLPATGKDGETQKPLVYRIREEGWSWSYTYSTDPQYTVSSKVDNPFTFSNVKKSVLVRRYAESKATNVFKTGETGGHYDDSKTNERP